MTEQIKDKPIIPFTMIPNEVIDAKKLSLQAKGLYSYLMSKPIGWIFSANRIASQLKESRNTINSVLQELSDFGLLQRDKVFGDGGKIVGMNYTLYGSESYREPDNGDQPPKPKLKEQVSLEARRNTFADEVKQAYTKVEGMSIEDARDFFKWWTQLNSSKTKMGFEMQRTWDINLRLHTWLRNKKRRRGMTVNTNNKTEVTVANT